MLNKEELKYILEDLHKNELSKVGKIKLEQHIINLQNKVDKANELITETLENYDWQSASAYYDLRDILKIGE